MFNEDGFLLCNCRNKLSISFAFLKFTRRSREPFISCENHFSYKKQSCDLMIDLTVSETLELLNQCKGKTP